MRSNRRIKILAVVLGTSVTMSGCGLFSATNTENGARAYAQRAAGQLADGKIPTPIAQNVDPAAAQKKLSTTLEGMGSLPHQVDVVEVDLAQDNQSGTITFAHKWTIHADKQPWSYQTTMPILLTQGQWQGKWSNQVISGELSETERLGATRLQATRGEIGGEGSSILVTPRRVARIGIDRSQAPSTTTAKTSARKLAALVDIDAQRYEAAVAAAGPQAFVEAIVYRWPSDDLFRVTPHIEKISGAVVVSDETPLPPSTGFATPILGQVGPATAEIIEKSNGKVRAGDVVGLTGLQATHEQRLAGTPGFAVQAIPASGAKPRDLFTVEPIHGVRVDTTLSMEHQEAAENTLKDIKPASALVAIRPSDGHVLAAASGPGSKGYSTATLGQYAPGSTFKTITALALLRAGVTPATTLPCTASITVDGRTFKNYDNYAAANLGAIPLRSVIAHSCNTALIAASDRLDANALAEAAAAVGLNTEPALGVPAALGSVPTTKGSTEHAASMIGQGRVVTTPLGMATAAASIAAGHPVKPILVTDPVSDTPGPHPEHPITEGEAQQVRSFMRAVVTDGSASFLQDVPGGPIMAKTGTAEYGNETPPRTHAWMIAIQGDLAVAVFVEDGPGGARTAGPLLKRFLTTIAGGPRR